ncbi:MAG: hypothetical protein Q8P70_00550 [bacterium]|nr:hypothetical protein [bacterium]
MQKIVPAILEQDPEETKKKLLLFKGVSEWVQIDIADGVFVNNRTHSVQDIPKESQMFATEVHLMVQDPEAHFTACQKIGANRVIFHLSRAEDLSRILKTLRSHTFEWGIALNPDVPVSGIVPYINHIQSLLIMSVVPGFQGSLFVPAVLQKIAQARLAKQNILVGVDGGVDENNISSVFRAGADYACVGSAIFNTENPMQTFQKLCKMVE